jgi:tetratricopeptide (TPR) repeat protein
MKRVPMRAAGFLGVVALAVLACLAGSCAGPEVGPYQVPQESTRNTARAEALTREAADILANDPAGAETLLREALTADLFHGPAHNNLGVLFLNEGKLYEAAHEFEWARKLLPGHPDPRVNLALVLETAGKVDDALAAYDAALEVYPDYLPAIMGAACLTLRTGREDERIDTWLSEIAMRSEDAGWREWARHWQSRSGR